MAYHHVYGTKGGYPQLEQSQLAVPIGNVTPLADDLPIANVRVKGRTRWAMRMVGTHPPDFLISFTTSSMPAALRSPKTSLALLPLR